MNNCLSSSETTREIELVTFNFKKYIEKGTPQHRPFPDKVFLEWFIGFFEAEGYFQAWKDKKGLYRFAIEIGQKDPGLMFKIRTRLGFGRVIEDSQNGELSFRFYTNKKEHLERLILVFDGHLITEKKRGQFKKWIQLRNERYNTQFLIQPQFLEVSDQTAWLSGFLEGDGGFWIGKPKIVSSIKKKGFLGFKFRQKFYITQKNEYRLLKKIQLLFQISSKLNVLTNGHSSDLYNRLETNSLQSQVLVLEYLDKYPFLGKRAIQLSRWKRLLKYRIKPFLLTPKSLKQFERLIEGTKP